MLKVAPVFNARDTTGLCRVYDKIEIHHRGFKALDVNASTHKGIIVPAVLGKLREGVKLQITCRKNYTEWKMEDLLKELLSELELREHCTMNKSEGSQYTHIDKDKKRKEDERNTANALLAQMNNFCAYCIVKLVEERRQSLPKYGRCFICVRKGHISHDCNSKLTCSTCKGKNHVSICYEGDSTNRDCSSRAHNGDCNDLPNSNRASNACLAHTTKAGGATC